MSWWCFCPKKHFPHKHLMIGGRLMYRLQSQWHSHKMSGTILGMIPGESFPCLARMPLWCGLLLLSNKLMMFLPKKTLSSQESDDWWKTDGICCNHNDLCTRCGNNSPGGIIPISCLNAIVMWQFVAFLTSIWWLVEDWLYRMQSWWLSYKSWKWYPTPSYAMGWKILP